MEWVRTNKGGYILEKNGVKSLISKESGKYWAMIFTYVSGEFTLLRKLPARKYLIESKRMVEDTTYFREQRQTNTTYQQPTFNYKSKSNPNDMWWANERY